MVAAPGGYRVLRYSGFDSRRSRSCPAARRVTLLAGTATHVRPLRRAAKRGSFHPKSGSLEIPARRREEDNDPGARLRTELLESGVSE